jgi:transcriptional regulator with XRE-family HTH domain
MGFKEIRKDTGLSQTEAAEVFGMKYRRYQNYENGVSYPSYQDAARMSRFFHCSIGELFGVEEGRTGITEPEKRILDMFPLSMRTGMTEFSPSLAKIVGKASQLSNKGVDKVCSYADDLIASRRYRPKVAVHAAAPEDERQD